MFLLFVWATARIGQEVEPRSPERFFAGILQLQTEGRYAEADARLKDALDDPAHQGASNQFVAFATALRGWNMSQLGKYTKAEQLFLYSIRILERSQGRDNAGLLFPMVNLLDVYLLTDQRAKAERMLDRALPLSEAAGERLARLRLLGTRARLFDARGRHSEAVSQFKETLRLAMDHPGLPPAEMATLLNNFGFALLNAGDLQQARQRLEGALAIWRDLLGSAHPVSAKTIKNLAAVYGRLDRPAEAERLYVQALEGAAGALGSDSLLVGEILSDYASLLRRMNRKSEASRIEKQAQAILARRVSDDPRRLLVDWPELQSKPR